MEEIKRLFCYRFNIKPVIENVKKNLVKVDDEEIIRGIATNYIKMAIDCHLVEIEHKVLTVGERLIVVEVPKVLPLDKLEKYTKRFEIILPFYDNLELGGNHKISIDIEHRIRV